MNWNQRYASEDHYKYIKHRNGKWVIIQKGTGKVLSTHDTREKAIASFKAMMMNKHGNVLFDDSDWRSEYTDLDADW